jgi:hypothetical protein
MVHRIHEYYSWKHVPPRYQTAKQWSKQHRRLIKGAKPVGHITLVFDKSRIRAKGAEAISREECQQVRKTLASRGADAWGQVDACRLNRAGQLAIINLYDASDTEEITCFTEVEARKLLGHMIWDHSHEDHYITEATEETGRDRATWKSDVSMPELRTHLEGSRYFGCKKGKKTMQITVDLDRHSSNIPGEAHIVKALKVGEILKTTLARLRFAPEINPNNGSVKFFGWLPRFTPMPKVEKLAEKLRAFLQAKLPEYDFSSVEIFPSSSPQIFAPLRADKIMVIGDGVLRKIKAWRMEQGNGKRKRRYYDAYSCADFLNWIHFSDKPFNAQVFEQELRAAVARCPDAAQRESAPSKLKKAKSKRSGGNGMGSIGQLKGRCASTLVKFWSELTVPDNDTIGKYLIVTARVLKYEGLAQEEALEWIEDGLNRLNNTSFSDRLTDDAAELHRVTAYAVEAVWQNNGYQRDSDLSDVKLRASVSAWAKQGFKLHDSSTWHLHRQASGPQSRLVWTAALLQMVPGLASIAHADFDQAKAFLESVLCFVEDHNELSETMTGMLLQKCDIKGKSRQKQHDVREYLVQQGLLIKQRNYYKDRASGYCHGNLYICGLAVAFEEEPYNTTLPVSIYLSLNVISEDNDLAIVIERRRLAFETRYLERLKRVRQVFRRAI